MALISRERLTLLEFDTGKMGAGEPGSRRTGHRQAPDPDACAQAPAAYRSGIGPSILL
jgi:hypothetical protein